MSKLQDFLGMTDVSEITDTIDIGGRLAGMPFTIKPITNDEFANYSKRAAKVEMVNGKKQKVVDTAKMNIMIISEHCTVPDFKEKAWLDKIGVATPEQAVNKTLLSGEISTLAEEIYTLSGFGQSIQEAVEEAKNL